jgi:glycosyltransferase involved in cell wall biosynthesis
VARVRHRLPGRVLLIGDGPDEAAVRVLVDRAGLSDVVHLVGRLSGNARLQALQRARLTVMPSRFETFGIVAVESHAVGTPVLAFDIACLREVVPSDAGRLVPAYDVAALAQAMVEMAGDGDGTAAMGRAGRRFARRFDWDLVARAQEAVLIEAAGPEAQTTERLVEGVA